MTLEAGASREMLTRLVSAAIMVPAALFLTWHSETAFALVTFVVGALVLYEWLRMVGAGHLVKVRLASWAALAVIAAAALHAPEPVAAALSVMAFGVFAVMVLARAARVRSRWVVIGLLYAGAAVISMVALRRGDDGFGVVLFVFLIAWTSDTMAFFVGRAVGGPKLWRSISPSKTWSGAAGGLAAGVAVGIVVAGVNAVPLTWVTVVVAFFVAIASQGGDLLESATKRHFKVKDAGRLIPGHGGVMDRVDGLIAASIVTLLLGSLVQGDTAASSLLSLMGR